jgi:hypothetical protein
MEQEFSIKKNTTERGFGVFEFKDLYGVNYSIQESSLATDDAIWIGVSEAKAKILVSGKGWQEYNIPQGVHIPTRMHINKEQAKGIVEVLNKFIETGRL